MRRLLVTGGSGFLGAAVLASASAAGWQVRGTALRHPRPGCEPLDVRDAAAVGRMVEHVSPHAIVHTAYTQAGPDAWPVIVDGSAAVAVAAAQRGVRLVHLSTDVIFDGQAGRPYREDDPPSPVNEYGRAKAEAERRVQAIHPDAVLVRTSLICAGPGRPPGQHERAALDATTTFYVDEVRCPVQVDDLAAALVELCGPADDVTGPLHVTGPDAVSRWELASLIRGGEVRDGRAPAGRPLDCRLDTALAQRVLRTRPRGIREVFASR